MDAVSCGSIIMNQSSSNDVWISVTGSSEPTEKAGSKCEAGRLWWGELSHSACFSFSLSKLICHQFVPVCWESSSVVAQMCLHDGSL